MRTLLLSALLVSGCVCAGAQTDATPELVTPEMAHGHAIESKGPFMPAIAKAAHVYGKVELQIVIDPAGHVAPVSVLSGPAMLQGAAIDAVRGWTYQPFLKDGKPEAVTTVVTLNFDDSTPPYSGKRLVAIPQAFLNAQEGCRAAMRDKDNPEKRAKACVAAAEAADSLGPTDSGLQKQAYVNAAAALVVTKQYAEAKSYADKAALALQQQPYDYSGRCTVLALRAEAEAGLNDRQAAEADLSKAEAAEKLEIAMIQSDLQKQEFKRILKNVLQFDAQTLSASGDQAAAQAKAAEAAAL